MKPSTPRHCTHCGGRLKITPEGGNGGPPFICTACGQAAYLDPKLAAACVVSTNNGIVLVRRAQRDQAHGLWILPGGHVDRGEPVETAAVREALEETGLAVELAGLLNVYSYPGNPVVLVVYAAQAVGGQINPGPEALEIAEFLPNRLPWDSLGYPSTGHALKDFLARAVAQG